MALSFRLIVLLFIFVRSSKTEDGYLERLAMKMSSQLLNAFDKNNFTKFDDFDVRFTYDQCHRIYEAKEFLSAVSEYRKTFPSGTVIKYGFLKAISTTPHYNGIQFNMHVEFLGQHHDMLVNFQQMKMSTGDRWRWVHAWKINCVQEHHKNVFTDDQMRQKVLS